jgi:putative endonuclease
MGWRTYYVYLLTNQRLNVLYTGVTNDMERRLWEHKNHLVRGFTKRYNCDRLVYVETFDEIDQAIAREKQIKGWTRAKKNTLVERVNPEWSELSIALQPLETRGST